MVEALLLYIVHQWSANGNSLLGRTEGKKCSPIDSGILGAYADIYRRLLVKKIQVLTS